MVVKSISRRMSDSMLMIARLTSLSWVMDVWRQFSISLSLEKERLVLQLVTRVWWEAPFWWEAWGPGPHGPSPKSGPAATVDIFTMILYVFCYLWQINFLSPGLENLDLKIGLRLSSFSVLTYEDQSQNYDPYAHEGHLTHCFSCRVTF